MKMLTACLLIASVETGAGFAQQRPATPRDMFYDPAWGQVFELSPVQTAPLRQVKPPDGHLQYVGIHYWFEGEDRRPVTAVQAATLGGAFSLHVRSNVSGFMGVWFVDGQRLQLTPEVLSDYGANRVDPGKNYTVSGDFQFFTSAHRTSLIVLLSRSETETVKSAVDARNKLEGIVRRVGKNGLPQLIYETEGTLANQVGHYVVNQTGGVVATEIVIPPTVGQARSPDSAAVSRVAFEQLAR